MHIYIYRERESDAYIHRERDLDKYACMYNARAAAQLNALAPLLIGLYTILP